MADVAETEPIEIVAGDTVEWNRKDLTDYPASTWTLKYVLRGPAVQNVTATADGDSYSIVLTAATTADWTEGKYSWEAFVTKGAGASLERYTVDSGSITVKPNLEAIAGEVDFRSGAQIAYDNAMTIWKAVTKHGSYSIAGRTYTSRNMAEIIMLVDKCKRDLMAERLQEKYDRLGINPRHIKTRFNR